MRNDLVLEQWRALLGDVGVPAPEVDWPAVEASLGTALPTDFRVLADNYPTLCIDDFLHVVHPAGEWTLREQNEQVLGALRGHRDNFPEYVPHPLFPEPGGVLCWGVTDNGDELFWLTEGEPDEWKVVVNNDDDGWTFDGGILSFLSGVLRGEVRCPAITETFPSPDWSVRAG